MNLTGPQRSNCGFRSSGPMCCPARGTCQLLYQLDQLDPLGPQLNRCHVPASWEIILTSQLHPPGGTKRHFILLLWNLPLNATVCSLSLSVFPTQSLCGCSTCPWVGVYVMNKLLSLTSALSQVCVFSHIVLPSCGIPPSPTGWTGGVHYTGWGLPFKNNRSLRNWVPEWIRESTQSSWVHHLPVLLPAIHSHCHPGTRAGQTLGILSDAHSSTPWFCSGPHTQEQTHRSLYSQSPSPPLSPHCILDSPH